MNILPRDGKEMQEMKKISQKMTLIQICRLEYADWYRALCPKYIQLVNEVCKTKEGFNILNVAVVDLKKRLCDVKNCQANAEKDNIKISINFVKERRSTICVNHGRTKKNKEK
jgi:hypothetical protein